MTKTQEALKLALEALESCSAGDYSTGHVIHPSFDVDAVNKAIEAIDEALAEQPYPDNFIHALMYDVAKRDSEAQQQEPVRVPVTDNTYNYAKSLAEAIFKQHFASDEHYASGRIVWGVNDTVIGILTQIDNMVADMVRRPAQQQEPVSNRENSIIRFALHQFMSNAYAHLTAAAQDKEGKRYPSEAVEKFAKDAEDAQALLKRLQFTSPPASKPWVGLTEDEADKIYKDGSTFGEMMRMVEAKLREKNA